MIDRNQFDQRRKKLDDDFDKYYKNVLDLELQVFGDDAHSRWLDNERLENEINRSEAQIRELLEEGIDKQWIQDSWFNDCLERARAKICK